MIIRTVFPLCFSVSILYCSLTVPFLIPPESSAIWAENVIISMYSLKRLSHDKVCVHFGFAWSLKVEKLILLKELGEEIHKWLYKKSLWRLTSLGMGQEEQIRAYTDISSGLCSYYWFLWCLLTHLKLILIWNFCHPGFHMDGKRLQFKEGTCALSSGLNSCKAGIDKSWLGQKVFGNRWS